MSLWRPKSLGMGVGGGELVIVDRINSEGAHVASQLPLRDYLPGAGSPETAIWEPAVSTALSQANKLSGRLQVSISDDWVRYWTVTPPKGLGSMLELRALAAGRFEQLFGAAAEAWHIEADWSANRPMLACALPRSLVVALNAVSSHSGCRIASVVPEAIRLINRDASQLKEDGWICCFGSHAFLALLQQRGQLLAARQFRFDLTPALPEVLAKLETEALRLGHDMPATVFLLGDAPPIVEVPGSSIKIKMPSRARPMPKAVGMERASDAFRLALHGVAA
ncbi:MAG: hypothetical protein QM776_18830 [Rhodocyclaceae bacterium]